MIDQLKLLNLQLSSFPSAANNPVGVWHLFETICHFFSFKRNPSTEMWLFNGSWIIHMLNCVTYI